MLRLSFFEVEENSINRAADPNSVSRIALRAKALSPSNALGDRYNVDPAYGHGFGERLVDLLPPNDTMDLHNLYEEKRRKKFGEERAG